jgi:hypothetical protein
MCALLVLLLRADFCVISIITTCCPGSVYLYLSAVPFGAVYQYLSNEGILLDILK